MQRHGVRCLLMGGQACVFYGAAEFSRDVDFAILAEPENLKRHRRNRSESPVLTRSRQSKKDTTSQGLADARTTPPVKISDPTAGRPVK
jgi:hypothetical protein